MIIHYHIMLWCYGNTEGLMVCYGEVWTWYMALVRCGMVLTVTIISAVDIKS